MYFSLFLSKMCVSVLCQHLSPNRCVNWSQRAVTAVKERARLHQTLRATGPLLHTSGYSIPVSMSSRHCRGQGSRAQVRTPGWPVYFHPTGLRSFGRCTRSRSSHSTCRGSQLSAALTPGQRVQKDTSASPVLHSDSRLSIQLCSSEPFSDQINDLFLQTQPTTQFSRSLTLIRLFSFTQVCECHASSLALPLHLLLIQAPLGEQTLTQKKLQNIWWLRCCRTRSHSRPASPPPSTDFLHSQSGPRTAALLWRRSTINWVLYL